MKFTINPYKGVNNLHFGMTKDEVREILSMKNFKEEFRRNPKSSTTIDSFYSLGLFINYDGEGKCEAFEFLGSAEVIYDGDELLGRSYVEFVKIIRNYDEDITEDESGCTSYVLGIGAYAPSRIKEPNEKLESIIVFKKGYYGV